MYRIDLKRVDNAFHFVATNAAGNEVHMDVGPAEGGSGQGAGPMQMVIMALGGCSSIDIVSILNKSRQQIDTYDVEIAYEREPHGVVPRLFTWIHVHYLLTGELDVDKVRRAIELSLDKYCSVSRILEKIATITYSFSVNGVRYEGRTADERVA